MNSCKVFAWLFSRPTTHEALNIWGSASRIMQMMMIMMMLVYKDYQQYLSKDKREKKRKEKGAR